MGNKLSFISQDDANFLMIFGKAFKLERCKNIILATAGFIAGDTFLNIIGSFVNAVAFTSALQTFLFILRIMQLAYSIFHIVYFMMSEPPKISGETSLLLATVVTSYTLIICVWSIIT